MKTDYFLVADLKAIAEGGWKAGGIKDVTAPAHRRMNLNTVRALHRRKLILSSYMGKRIFPGDPLEIAQAGRDLIAEYSNA